MKCRLSLIIAALPFLSVDAQEIKSYFNAAKPILPSSQYTPEKPYSAEVWVFNDGQRYADQYYNHIWASPEADSEGRQWFEPGYEADWQTATTPFSSDDYYLGKKSYRWITSDIMGEIYLRRTFTINDLVQANIFLACGHDDAPAEWYINGVQVHSVSDGWNNDEYVLLTPEQKELIHMDGTENLLAVHVHQNWGGAFADCGLYEADMTETVTYLPTLSDGPWPCNYYILNYNTDLADAESAGWASESEDESDWITGVGPFSNDANMFFTTEWPSQVRPILIRRHFSLSGEDLATIADGTMILRCSYDENPKVYLNGSLIWSAQGWNDNDYSIVTLTDENKELLHSGDNVLTVSLMQGGGGGHIDYGLALERPVEFSGLQLPTVSDNENADQRVFNLSGQFLGKETKSLSKGIYIQGHKKLIIL